MIALSLIYPNLTSMLHLRCGAARWTLCGRRLHPCRSYGYLIACDGRACPLCIRQATARGYTCPTCRIVLIGQAAGAPCPTCGDKRLRQLRKGVRWGQN